MAAAHSERANLGEAIALVDEAATLTLARQLAGFVNPGDFIALAGDLGAGKTTLARGFLRALLDDPELEAPSPTFTLMQVYDGPGFPVVHADFYRLRGADELAQIGWDEAIDGAVTLAEWPERAAEALPPDRLEIALYFDPAYGPEFRRAEIAAFGAVGPRWRRMRAIERLLREAGWAEAERAPLAGDASIRAYERLRKADGRTAILMISPPRADGPILRYGKPYAAIARLSPDIRAFLAMAEGLRAQGYSTPQIYAHDVADGLALIEDFGAETIADAQRPGPRALRRSGRAARRSARTRPAARAADRRRKLRAADLRHRGDADRSRAGARLVRADGGARAARLRRAPGVPRPVARRCWRRSSPSRPPGRCATITRPTCIGSPAARGSPGSA